MALAVEATSLAWRWMDHKVTLISIYWCGLYMFLILTQIWQVRLVSFRDVTVRSVRWLPEEREALIAKLDHQSSGTRITDRRRDLTSMSCPLISTSPLWNMCLPPAPMNKYNKETQDGEDRRRQ